ncbi:hypothetical protein B0H17DRAFT_1202529 [Mycena rosella]|uniref:Uncharacterized protein n=1 Tax=Mycena rosella TaxID=1033263 RepID=A0AAD7DDN0_MYCRO|nr:hypothetical protein B0H17DRAFT_1202529 [Mycena rosella]
MTSLAPVPARGRGHPRGRGGKRPTASKRSAADLDNEYLPEAEPITKKKKMTGVLPLRSPSKRKGICLHPGAPDMPVLQRSSSEVALERNNKVQKLQDMIAARDAAIAAVAAMEEAQDLAVAAEACNAVLSVSDLDGNGMCVDNVASEAAELDCDPKDSDTEFFVAGDADFARIENDPGAYLSDDPFPATKASQKAAKIFLNHGFIEYSKGQVKAAIEEELKHRKESSKATSGRTKKSVQNSDAAAASSNTGVNSWFLGLMEENAGRGSSPLSSPGLGGLGDADAVSTRPTFVKKEPAAATALKPGMSTAGATKPGRRNEVIVVEDSDEDEQSPIIALPKPKLKSVKAEVSKMPALAFGLHQKISGVIPGKSTKSQRIAVPVLPSFDPHPPATSTALPDFAYDKWTSVIMPGLHRALNTSDAPWDVGFQNDLTLQMVQKVIHAACPNFNYTAKWGDPVIARASALDRQNGHRSTSARLCERRSKTGAKGVDVLSQYITDNGRLFPTADAVKIYVRYALNKRGPALFKYPTPVNRIGVTDKKDLRYVKAKGLFESDFVIAVFAPLLKVGGTELPYGAVALAAAAVEHAFVKYRSGHYEGTSTFAKNSAGTAIDGYMVATHKLSTNAWERILRACNERSAQAVDASSDAEDGDLSLNSLREDLYEGSSPYA